MNETTPITAEWALDAEAHPLDAPVEEQPPEPIALPTPKEEAVVPPELREAREAMADELEPLFARADELEARMNGIARRSTILAESARGHLTAPRHFSEPFLPEPAVDTELSLNALSSEEFQDLGLSRTQAARLIARRESRGGFSSVRELDEVPGLPHELRAELRRVFTARS